MIQNLSALQIRRICSRDEEAEEFIKLEKKLCAREYNKVVVRAGINKSREVTREAALRRVESRTEGEGGHQHRIKYDRRTGPLM